MAEFWMGSDPGIPLEEVWPIPGLAVPKDGYVNAFGRARLGHGDSRRVDNAVGPRGGD